MQSLNENSQALKMHKLSFMENTQHGPYSSPMKIVLDIVTRWALEPEDTQVLPVSSRARIPPAAFLTGIGSPLLAHPLGQGAHCLSELAWELGMAS